MIVYQFEANSKTGEGHTKARENINSPFSFSRTQNICLAIRLSWILQQLLITDQYMIPVLIRHNNTFIHIKPELL
jgi:hypothetical protein